MTAVTTTFTGIVTHRANPFADLPDLMKTILEHEENTDTNIALQEAHALSRFQSDAMMAVIRGVILKTIPPDRVVDELKHELHLDADHATSLARELLGQRFLPMEWHIGPVQPLIAQLGGNVEEYLARARQLYPEVYQINQPLPVGESVSLVDINHLLGKFDEWVTTPRGKAEILLRLTNLSTLVDEAVREGRIAQADGERLLAQLDSVSYAVNTQDLSTFELHSMKRQIEKFVGALQG